MEYIGVDVGTSSLKSVVFDTNANKLLSFNEEYQIITPKSNYAEENPLDWYNASVKTLIKIGKLYPKCKGLSFSGQMHGLVLLDKDDNILRNAIIWCDFRTNEMKEYIEKYISDEEVKRITGNHISLSFTLAKLLWVKENERDIFDKIDKVMLPKDYVKYMLTGNFSTDISDASGMQMVDINTYDYSKELLDKFGIPLRILPPIVKSTTPIGKLKKELQESTKLTDLVVVSGAGDQAACAIGSGIYKNDQISLVLGSSGVVLSPIEKNDIKQLESNVFIGANDKPFTMLVTNGCGLSYKWYKENLCDFETKVANDKNISVYDVLNEEAKNARPLSNGLFYLPYLNGERDPHVDPFATGTFIGINQATTKADFTRSILEGVAYSLKECYEYLPKKDYKIYVSGGGAKAKLWKQIIASMLKSTLYEVDSQDAGALGAAIIAMVSLKEYETFDVAIKKLIKEKDKTLSNKDLEKIYDKGLENYKLIYKALKPVYKKIKE
jgi:xylulokinase